MHSKFCSVSSSHLYGRFPFISSSFFKIYSTTISQFYFLKSESEIPKMNSVAQLKEYHDKHPIGNPPFYTYDTDILSKRFTATCKYRNSQTYGLGSSKKDSQKEAAEKMLAIVRPLAPAFRTPAIIKAPAINASSSTTVRAVIKALTEAEKQKANLFLSEYGDEDPNSDARNSMAPDRCIIQDINVGLKGEDAPKSVTLASESQYVDAIDTFKQVMKEMKLKFLCKVPEIKQVAQSQHIVFIRIVYDRMHMIAGGIGSSVESATYAACDKAIAMLKVYIS